jgi:hypothetical protein
MALVGIGEIARMVKRDPKAIRNAVKSGRITQRPDGLFDTETAVAEWNAATMKERGHNNRTKKVVEIDQQPAVPEEPTDVPLNGERPAKGSDYAKARAVSQIYEARMRKLRYDERAKTLTPAQDVADAAFQSYRCLRDACMNIPSRLAGLVAAETDVERCFQMIENEIVIVFNDFSEGKIA